MLKIRYYLQKGPYILWTWGLLVIVALLSLRKIHLPTADLGRHLANGLAILNDPDVLTKNFYSFTYPDVNFINHHWGSGVIFYWIHQWAGFEGLSYTHMLLTTLAFMSVFFLAKRLTTTTDACLAATVVLPLVVSRTEVRPEVFSYAMTGIFFYILSGWRTKQLNTYWLAALPLLMIFWVNIHIYFFMGLALIGFFILDTKEPDLRRDLIAILVFAFIATFVNPLSWHIALFPLNIFQNYGYMIAENQSVPFFWTRPMYILGFGSFHVVTLVLGLSLAILALIKTPFSRAFVAIAFFTWALGLSAIRNFALFGLCAIPALAMVGYILDATRLRLLWRSLLLVLAIGGHYYDWSHILPTLNLTWGPGLYPGVNRGAEFFLTHHIKGPIFNNYDIGSYLIYHLFPDSKVFVDNRPEAYPKEFFQNVYVPMQEDSAVWQEMDAKYGFNAIIYYVRDNTPAGQNFLISRVKDPAWAPVFVDQDVIIFVRKIPANQPIIERFELPREMFRISSKSTSS